MNPARGDMPGFWRPHRADYLRVNGRCCHVLDLGHGRPVVALHGLGSVAQEIALPLLPLKEHYRLIVPDRPGYGTSSSLGLRKLPPDQQAGWLRAVLRRLGVSRPIIVAHSIASAVALSYALRFPDDVAGMVLVAPFCRPTRPARMPLLRLALLPIIGRLLRTWVFPMLMDWLGRNRMEAAFAPNAVPAYLRAMPVRALVKPDSLLTMAAELFGFNAAMIARRNALHRLEVPTVVLAGEADRTADPDLHATWVAHRLPHARLIRVNGVGHMLQHARPKIVLQAIDEVARQAA